MRLKTLISIFIVALVAVILLVFRMMFNNDNQDNEILGNLELTKVDSIRLEKNQEILELKKNDQGFWQVNGFAADQEKIKILMEKAGALKVINLVSKNPDNFTKFDLNDNSAKKMIFNASNSEILNLIIGKTGSDWNSTYLRLATKNEVFLVDQELNSLFSLVPDNWRDKTVLNIDSNKITKIEFVYPNKKFVLTKAGEQWQAKIGDKKIAAAVSPTVMSDLFSKLSPLSASSFADQEKVKQFENAKNLTQIIFFIGDNQQLTQLTVLKTQDLSLVKVDTRSDIFIINQEILNEVLLNDDQLFL